MELPCEARRYSCGEAWPGENWCVFFRKWSPFGHNFNVNIYYIYYIYISKGCVFFFGWGYFLLTNFLLSIFVYVLVPSFFM